MYVVLSILDLSKTVMFEFLYDYVKPKYGENAKDIAEDVETRFHTSNSVDRTLPIEKNKKVIGLMKDELGGQIVKEFVGLKAKTYSYLKENNNEDKKAKSTKKCVIKRKLKFEDYKNCLEAAQIENKINNLEKNKIDVDSLKEDQKEFVKIIN